MRNAENFLKKTCIALDMEDYASLIEKLTDNRVTAEVEYQEGAINYVPTEEAEDDGVDNVDITNDEVNRILSEYFDVKVSSVHADGFDRPYAWIVYTE